eukprot:TRINITY_DN4457_c0_g1_i3.p1 TRINITY_DN4457_c0_g1~~TRINITY_DN4457_c0_g1_i3.p1  ORF type:complete len:256 (+),score=52.27 TRINITY_DN4457_c0_g1_i3:316-1083(+)
MSDRDTWMHLVAGGVGGTTGAIVTCPLEVVKTRLQSSNSGFDTKLKIDTVNKELESTLSKNNKANWVAGKVSHVVYRPALGSQYSWSVQLLNSNWGHFGSSTPILYSTQSQPCRPLQSKLSAFGDRTSVKIHTGSSQVTYAQTKQTRANPGVWACLMHIWKREGVKGLYRGLGPNLVGVAPSRAIYFWSYSTTKKNLNNSLPKVNRDTPFVHVLFCSFSRICQFLCNNPTLAHQDQAAARQVPQQPAHGDQEDTC